MGPPSAVVVGAGVFGASVADALAGRGWAVTIVERRAPAHPGSSSGGCSRILRHSHGADRWYTRSAARSRAAWIALGEQTGRRLFVESGVVWFARHEDGWEADSLATMPAEGVPCERLQPSSAAALYPPGGLAIDDLAWVLYEPTGGVLRAAAAVAALVERARRRGARLEIGHAEPERRGVLVGGRRLEADRIVWAAGPWLAAMVGDPDAPGAPLRVTRQDVCHFAVPPSWRAERVPAWVDYDGTAYGLGDLDGAGFKAAVDVVGPAYDPERATPALVPAAAEAVARTLLTARFPALAGAPLVSAEPCPYTLTADTHFLAAPSSEDDRVWFVGGGSGHGFKHGPAWGEAVAAMVTGEARADPRFGLGGRLAQPGLRTSSRSG
jgi:glycine/D-amino acid oxidase-like deaminating enzyme